MAAGLRRLEGRGLVSDGALTEFGREERSLIEELTEGASAAVLASIGDDLDLVVERASAWSERIVERGWFPPDPYKRAAG